MSVSVIFGAESEFLSTGNSRFNKVITLDPNKIVVNYVDDSDSSHGTSKVGTVSGTDIVFGSETEFFGGGDSDWIAAESIDSSGFIVAYRNGPDSNNGYARVGTVSGTTITFGAEVKFSFLGGVNSVNLCLLSDTKFIVGYTEDGDSTHGKVKVGTISGTTITFGDEIKFHLQEANFLSLSTINESGFIIAYQHITPDKGVVSVGTVSGTEVTFGDEFIFNDASSTRWIATATLTPSKFVVVYRDDSDSFHGTAKIGTVVGTNVSFGAESEFLAVFAANYMSLGKLDSSRFIVAYSDVSESANGYGTVKVGTVNDTTINFGVESEFLSADYPNRTNITVLDINKFVVAYGDFSDSGHGTARIGEVVTITKSRPLFIEGLLGVATLSRPLFIKGHSEPITLSQPLFVEGHSELLTLSQPLFIRGLSDATALARPLDWLIKSQDYNPQIIGTLSSASSVNIQVWDVTDGQNVLMSLESSGCYAIGNTGRWGWSTTYLPSIQGHAKHYFYMMTSDTSETFDGQFILDVPEGAKWIHPGSRSDYLL